MAAELYAVRRLMALAVIRHTPLEVPFSRCIFKFLVGEKFTMSDLERIDPDFIKHRIRPLLKDGGVAETEAIICDELYFTGTEPHGDDDASQAAASEPPKLVPRREGLSGHGTLE